MQIWSLNSKKCSKAEAKMRLGLFAIAVITIIAARPSLAVQPAKIPVTTPMMTSLKSDLATRNGTSFDHLLVRWERQYGVKAVEPLLSIAGDSKNPDADRYVALMGAARLGGYSSAPLFVPFLKDSSWMIRSASLRVLTALENAETAQAVLPLLKDPALVVRLEAVNSALKLKPVGVVPGLVDSLNDEANYHGGKALWVPQKAIEALVTLRAKEALPKLRPLLDRSTDPEFLAKTVDALDTLAGQMPESELATSDRVTRWKVALGKATEQSDSIATQQASRKPIAAQAPDSNETTK
jgi:HEAT repeat protein